MKALLAVVLIFTAVISHGQTDHFSGGLITTICPVKAGGQITLDVDVASGFVIARVVDDGVLTETLTGFLDARARFVLTSADGISRLVGRIRTVKGPYTIFTGTGRDAVCRYKIQGRFRRTL